MASVGDFKKLVSNVNDLLSLVDNVAEVQEAQALLAEEIAFCKKEIIDIRADMKALKPEIRLEASQETREFVVGVQNGFYDRLHDLALKVSKLEIQANGSEQFMASPKNEPLLPTSEINEKSLPRPKDA